MKACSFRQTSHEHLDAGLLLQLCCNFEGHCNKSKKVIWLKIIPPRFSSGVIYDRVQKFETETWRERNSHGVTDAATFVRKISYTVGSKSSRVNVTCFL